MFKDQDIIDYYNACEIHYKLNWKLDQSLAMHYGYYDEENKDFAKSLINMNAQLAKKVNITSDDYVLDAGCGVGGSSIFLAKFIGCKAHGITIVEKQVESAEQHAVQANVEDKATFSRQSYLNTNFPDDTFDVVWAVESVCHAPNKADFYKEAYRVLKPGGRIIIADYFMQSELNQDGIDLVKKWLHCWAIDSIPTQEEQYENLKNFKDVQIENWTEYMKPSAFRMYRQYYIGYILHRIYDLIYTVSKESEANFQSAKYQYQALKKDYWKYLVTTAIK